MVRLTLALNRTRVRILYLSFMKFEFKLSFLTSARVKEMSRFDFSYSSRTVDLSRWMVGAYRTTTSSKKGRK